jgi:predicted ArsR family transcriptional regulator
VSDELAAQVAGIAALLEPARRALYLHVATQPDAVSREQAANAVNLPLHSVKFHLDRLVEEGLLDVEFRRLSGRTGPGAGRPSKLYRRSSRQLSVSLPERRYDLAGEVLATAIARSSGDDAPIADAVRDAAGEAGRRIAAAAAHESKAAVPGVASAVGAGRVDHDDLVRAARVLTRHGYEPRTSDREIRLGNCPFDQLAAKHAELVCGMNLALIRGVIDGLGLRGLSTELAPQPGYCCVKIRS